MLFGRCPKLASAPAISTARPILSVIEVGPFFRCRPSHIVSAMNARRLIRLNAFDMAGGLTNIALLFEFDTAADAATVQRLVGMTKRFVNQVL